MEGASKSQQFEERLLNFSKEIIVLCQRIQKNDVSRPILNQLIRSGTSIGANYCEANNASSKKDFRNNIFICKKEAQETQYWLKLCFSIAQEHKKAIDDLLQENKEFSLIFQKITNTMKNNQKNEK